MPQQMPWDKYAQQPQTEQPPWEKYGQQGAGAPPANPAQKGPLSSFADSSGLSSLAHAIAHPIDTVEGVPATVKGIVNNTLDNARQGVADYKQSGLSTQTRRDFGRAVPIVGPALAEAQAQHDAGNNSGMAGTLAGTVAGLAGPEIVKGALPALGSAMTKVGEGAQDSGVGLLNKTVGTLKPDFKRGANPGRGYFEAGNGPSLSMQSIADKAANSKTATAQAMGDLRASTPVKIPRNDVQGTVAAPIDKARALEMGPGGLGNTSTIDAYENQFKPTLSGMPDEVTPEDVFQLKRGIAQNTNWSDPTQFNLKAVRQQQTAGLGDLLNTQVPGYGELAQRYGDLTSLTKRAQSRAETGSSPLTTLAAKGFHSGVGALATGLGGAAFGHAPEAAIGGALLGAAVDSVPVRSTVASGLYYGGRGASSLGDTLSGVPTLSPAAVAPPAYYLSAKAHDSADKKNR
jgi:hypothetical protein